MTDPLVWLAFLVQDVVIVFLIAKQRNTDRTIADFLTILKSQAEINEGQAEVNSLFMKRGDRLAGVISAIREADVLPMSEWKN